METYRQRIGHSHEDTIALRLHLILLAADVYDNLLGLRRLDAEVSTTLRVYLREVIARNGVLTSHSISRYVDLLDGHRNGSPAHDSQLHRSADGQDHWYSHQMKSPERCG